MRNLLIILIAFFALSCSSSKMLQKSLQKPVATIGYIHDSKIEKWDRSTKVQLLINDQSAIDSTTTVKKEKGKALPLLFFNHFENNMGVKLGENSFSKPYVSFLKDEFCAEAKRSGKFTVVDKECPYSLEITIDTCCVESKYQMSTSVLFLFIAYSYSVYERGSPAVVTLDMNVKLKKNNVEIYSKNYHVGREQPFVTTQTKQLYVDFIANMTEGLALGSKDLIEKVISDANAAIAGETAMNK